MRIVTLPEAKAQLSILVDAAASGESFIITKAGKPMVKVVALELAVSDQPRRIGFMAGRLAVPEDFDRMGEGEIEGLFGGGE